MKRVLLILAMITGMLGYTVTAVQAEPARWSEELFAQFQKEYGVAGASRLRRVYETLIAEADAPLETKLRVVNDTLNKLPWVTDRDKWHAEDYWATPIETIALYGGDCEDMAIGKYVGLRLLGVPEKNLYLGYVRVRATGEPHMVLVWLSDDHQHALVLDNMIPEIKTGNERDDLVGVYLFDAAGDLILLDDDGQQRTIKAEIGQRRLEKLETIKARIRENREKYRQYNGGRPTF
ncbi:hypothetical protein GCM10011348_12200 [Marinobacterium nitratireducens]|uniref:Transglutaminase-like cysteine proteinase BTLCP n=1 Tax=Marinobacterium nitratireducens TaxID=518897 RepID=A0A917ZCB4_9GAMM|nr:transglutaminase-like cysteine peptidase [Marinobacterium nitratireducens]GGO78995.1 hypothetical protein GCM10011348_12200 [Marinobacterium nitratireducens]